MKTLIGFVIFFASIEGAAAQSAVLRVRVKTAEGVPVWGALVSIWARPTDHASRYTNPEGEFSRPVNAGQYRIMVRAGGFREHNEVVEVAGADTITRDIELTPDRYGWFGGVHLGGPALLSAAVGPTYLADPGLGARASDERRGRVFAMIEPGVNAGRVSAGYLVMAGNLASGWSARASVLKRWTSRNGLYVGGEVGGMLVGGLGPRLGLFTPIRGTDRRGIVFFIDFGIAG